jgi:hypothetical protein
MMRKSDKNSSCINKNIEIKCNNVHNSYLNLIKHAVNFSKPEQYSMQQK